MSSLPLGECPRSWATTPAVSPRTSRSTSCAICWYWSPVASPVTVIILGQFSPEEAAPQRAPIKQKRGPRARERRGHKLTPAYGRHNSGFILAVAELQVVGEGLCGGVDVLAAVGTADMFVVSLVDASQQGLWLSGSRLQSRHKSSRRQLRHVAGKHRSTQTDAPQLPQWTQPAICPQLSHLVRTSSEIHGVVLVVLEHEDAAVVAVVIDFQELEP